MGISRLTSTSPDMANSIENFIAAGEDSAIISYYNFSVLQVEFSEDKTIRVDFTIDNLINDYMDILQEACKKVKLTNAEKIKYYYNPDLLAYDIYGSTELDFLVMRLNGIIDPKDFDMPSLKLLYKTDLVNLMNRIYSAENAYLTANRESNGLFMPV